MGNVNETGDSSFNSFRFIHIEKSGGTSLRQSFVHAFKRLNYHESMICNSDIDRDASRKIQLVHQNYIKQEGDYVVTALRDPVPRLISHFHYFDKISRPGNPNSGRFSHEGFTSMLDMPDQLFVKYVRTCGELCIIRLSNFKGGWERLTEEDFLLARINLSRMDFVFIVEQLKESINWFNQTNTIGLFLKNKKENLNQHDKAKVNDEQSYELRMKITSHLRFSHKLYEYAVSKFGVVGK